MTLKANFGKKMIIQRQNRSIVKLDNGLSTRRRTIVPEDRWCWHVRLPMLNYRYNTFPGSINTRVSFQPAVVRFDWHNNLSGRRRCLSSSVATRKLIENFVFTRTKPVRLRHTTFTHANVETRRKRQRTWFCCLFSFFWRPPVPVRIILNSAASSSTWTTPTSRGR